MKVFLVLSCLVLGCLMTEFDLRKCKEDEKKAKAADSLVDSLTKVSLELATDFMPGAKMSKAMELRNNPARQNIYEGKAVVISEAAQSVPVILRRIPKDKINPAVMISNMVSDDRRSEGDLIECFQSSTHFYYKKPLYSLSDICPKVAEPSDLKLEDLNLVLANELKKLGLKFDPNAVAKEIFKYLQGGEAQSNPQEDHSSGSFGAIRIATSQSTGTPWVGKAIQKKEFLIQEALTLRAVGQASYGPNFKFCLHDGAMVYLFMEKMLDNLESDSFQNYFQGLGLKAKLEELAKIVEPWVAFHEAGWVHEDPKPANIMRDSSGNYHLIDFGGSVREGALALPSLGNDFASLSKSPRDPTSQYQDVHSLILTLLFVFKMTDDNFDKIMDLLSMDKESENPIDKLGELCKEIDFPFTVAEDRSKLLPLEKAIVEGLQPDRKRVTAKVLFKALKLRAKNESKVQLLV